MEIHSHIEYRDKHRHAGTYARNYGVTDALTPFLLHSLVNLMSATIDNNTVSFNVQETFPLLLRMVDPEEFAKYDDCMTPKALDYLADYDGALYPAEYLLMRLMGRMLLLIPLCTRQQTWTPIKTHATNTTANTKKPGSPTPKHVRAYDMNRTTGTAYYHEPRGS